MFNINKDVWINYIFKYLSFNELNAAKSSCKFFKEKIDNIQLLYQQLLEAEDSELIIYVLIEFNIFSVAQKKNLSLLLYNQLLKTKNLKLMLIFNLENNINIFSEKQKQKLNSLLSMHTVSHYSLNKLKENICNKYKISLLKGKHKLKLEEDNKEQVDMNIDTYQSMVFHGNR